MGTCVHCRRWFHGFSGWARMLKFHHRHQWRLYRIHLRIKLSISVLETAVRPIWNTNTWISTGHCATTSIYHRHRQKRANHNGLNRQDRLYSKCGRASHDAMMSSQCSIDERQNRRCQQKGICRAAKMPWQRGLKKRCRGPSTFLIFWLCNGQIIYNFFNKKITFSSLNFIRAFEYSIFRDITPKIF